MKLGSLLTSIFSSIVAIITHMEGIEPLSSITTALAIVSGIIFFSILISGAESDDFDGDGH